MYVYLTQEAVDSGKVYTVDDFPELDFIKSVKTLDYKWIDPPNSVLYLAFSKNDKKTIEAIIKLCKERDDVEDAQPVPLISI